MKPLQRVLEGLKGVKRSRKGHTALCPAHEDRNPSLSVSEGDDGRVLLHCHAGCETEAVLQALGIKPSDLFEPFGNGRHGSEIVATYDYTDEDGDLLFQAVRYFPRDFRQRRPDGRDGWTWNLRGARRVLYRLPRIIEAVGLGKTIYLAEGEKDVHALETLGAVATCNPMGAGKWREDYSEALRDAVVRIVADKDKTGRDHARAVAESLEGVAASVELLQAKEGKDPHHMEAGYGLEDFVPMTEPGGVFASLAELLENPAMMEPPEAVVARLAYRDHATLLCGPDKRRQLLARDWSAPAVGTFQRWLKDR